MSFKDVPWGFFPMIVSTKVQESIGIICIYLPALAPLAKRRTKKSVAQYEYSVESSVSRKRESMGTVTLYESSFDEKNDDGVPLKGIK